MLDTTVVKVKMPDGTIQECDVTVSKQAPWKISLSGVEQTPIESEGSDLFKALFQLRRQLEQMQMQMLCNGSRENMVCSGMSRSMGGGRKAYLVELGQPARRDSLVDIFAFAQDEFIVSTTEQEQFYSKWVESLK